MVNDDLLRRDIRLLEGVLEGVIVELAGQETFDRLAVIRRLARERRGGEHAAEQPLAERIESLDPATARNVVQAMTIYFDLVNIAEDRQRVRVLRDRERTSFPEPLGESLAAGLKELKQLGLGSAEVQQALDRLNRAPVASAL